MRKALHLSQKKFADSVGISLGYVNFIEMGYNNPSDKLIDKICNIHGISKRWLTTGVGNMFDEGNEEKFNASPSAVCENDHISNVEVGERLKILRRKLDLTQAEMAEKLGISTQTYSSWENDFSKVKMKDALKIAKLCGISIDEFKF